MNEQEHLLWQRIQSFPLDQLNATFPFSKRLARENGWPLNYTLRVIEEYKKFIFLCCIVPGGVTPSDQVDQAWHLHLTYTESYWTDLCQHTLNKPIHHHPTKGGATERQKFRGLYEQTAHQYQHYFQQTPPPDIWLNARQRFSQIHFVRVNKASHWIIPKPEIRKSQLVYALLIPFALWGCLSSQTSIGSLGIFVVGSAIAWAVYQAIKNNKQGTTSTDNGCSAYVGCDSSTSHHNHDADSSDSGCSGDGGGDSGCSGCSGCGGGD